MKITYPSPEFDDAVAAVCHGLADESRCRALNELLREDGAALDEYILRVEIHSRLASDEDLFVGLEDPLHQDDENEVAVQSGRNRPRNTHGYRNWWIWGAAAILVLTLLGIWRGQPHDELRIPEAGSQAVAMLDRTVRAQWANVGPIPLTGDSLEPGWLTLEAGLAQIVFYKGTRLIVEGPAEFQLLTPSHLSIRKGKVTADVPSQSSGFRIDTPHGSVSGGISNLGIETAEGETSIHVFSGEVNLRQLKSDQAMPIGNGIGVVVTKSGTVNPSGVDGAAFASLYDFHAESSAALAMQMDNWEVTGERLNNDPSLLVRIDFDQFGDSLWKLRNLSRVSTAADHAAIVGCHWGEGRWPGKRALEFQNVNDRVRMDVQGEYESLTLSAWVRIQGLDRELNSLFMSDGFAEKTIHWLIRNDGVLGMTIVGQEPQEYQIVASPPVLKLDRIGRWIHLAAVIDGKSGRVSHYIDGQEVDRQELQIEPPYRVGPSELGNWSARGFPEDNPFMIRNFSGAMDEFCLFSRALDLREVQALYSDGRPGCESLVSLE